jgi:hypothetical protein
MGMPTFRRDAPLSKWKRGWGFDSEAACKKAIASGSKAAHSGSFETFHQALVAEQISNGRSIASDDPRLKEKYAMNLRHAAALALVGWYLIMPPRSVMRGFCNDDAPLQLWKIVESFDTAAECTRSRSDASDRAKREHRDFLAYVYSEEACIASDDPRLKEK